MNLFGERNEKTGTVIEMAIVMSTGCKPQISGLIHLKNKIKMAETERPNNGIKATAYCAVELWGEFRVLAAAQYGSPYADR
jgi:hypothetical protein